MWFRPSFDGTWLDATGALTHPIGHDRAVEGCKKRLPRFGRRTEQSKAKDIDGL
jgi:hypothetical protein